MNQIPNIEDEDLPELEKQYVAMWDKGEFEWNHHEGDKLGRKPISPWRIWTTFIKPTLHQQLQKARGEWYIGQRLKIFKGDYVVVGVSTMVYDEDCEGEPEWKITDQVQEVAIAIYYNDTSYQKPCWLKVSELQAELDQPINSIFKE